MYLNLPAMPSEDSHSLQMFVKTSLFGVLFLACNDWRLLARRGGADKKERAPFFKTNAFPKKAPFYDVWLCGSARARSPRLGHPPRRTGEKPTGKTVAVGYTFCTVEPHHNRRRGHSYDHTGAQSPGHPLESGEGSPGLREPDLLLT